MLHAADYEFGLLTELIVQATVMCLTEETTGRELAVGHFAKTYHRRSGAPGGLNPFLAENFEHIDVRKLLEPVR
ncbi:hypothetical protein [Shimia ponticola]|uniref:hypothetical protein n=1 Tax=Shimia ponticola TaxID=2582893 RepID=UPI00164AED95|nr:hypothetical protein [Shimia ponticola]